MLNRKNSFLLPIAVGAILIAALAVFWPTTKANAQCGSQASSCKNCHEVQGQDPVNNDGTGWHTGHAFGDFCYICHGGNNQSMDKDAAHTGMVPPLSDVKAGCQSCHPNDLMERANVYAAALGVQVGSGGPTSSAGSGSGGATSSGEGAGASAGAAPSETEAGLSAPAGLVVDQKDVIDYNQIYAGKTPVNVGNVILIALILLVAAGGGTFVYFNERKLRGFGLKPAVKAEPAANQATALPNLEQFSPEVVALLPQLQQLSPVGIHALKRLLENPEEASELLHSLSRLDPELVRRIRSLDRESRAVLLALSGGD